MFRELCKYDAKLQELMFSIDGLRRVERQLLIARSEAREGETLGKIVQLINDTRDKRNIFENKFEERLKQVIPKILAYAILADDPTTKAEG